MYLNSQGLNASKQENTKQTNHNKPNSAVAVNLSSEVKQPSIGGNVVKKKAG